MENHPLPVKNWKTLKSFIKYLGEEDQRIALGNSLFHDDLTSFLHNIKLVGDNNLLSPSGKQIFEAMFIRLDFNQEKEILRNALLSYQPTLSLQQYLWGLKNIAIEQAITVLKSTGLWESSTPEELTHFLDMLNYVRIISYDKRGKKFKIFISPDTERTPTSVFIDPMLPFSNIRWIKKILSECRGYIYWTDKHFKKEALDWIWAIADSNNIIDIKILSLDLGDDNLNKEAKDLYKRLKKELLNKGIQLTWSTIDSKSVRDSHDRWIVANYGVAWNVPSVGAINSGQRSELNRSENHKKILEAFKQYWKLSQEIQI